jgi:hypothetical protein
MYWIFLNVYFYRNFFRIFFVFRHHTKKLCFYVHFDVFLSEVWLQRHPADPPLLLGFIAITDHPSAGEALPGSSS